LTENAVYRVERRAIEKNKEAILSADNSDHICLALKGDLDDQIFNHTIIRLLARKIRYSKGGGCVESSATRCETCI